MPFDYAAYRARIGLGDVRPDAAGLAALQRAHLGAIAYENFDPLLGRVPALELERIVAKIVDGGRGGYCFELNLLFEAALKAAGFAPRRMLARVRMRGGADVPRSHLILAVETPEGIFLADAGFGGPGPLMPLALGSRAEQVAPNGTFRFTDDPASGEVVLERQDGEGWVQLHAFDGAHVTFGEIAAANYVCATWNAAPFPDHLLIGRYDGEVRYGLFDRALTVERPDGIERRELAGFAEFAAFVRDTAGLPIAEAALVAAWDRIGQG